MELFARLANTGALARVCDDRRPDAVTRDWHRRFYGRLSTVEAQLTRIYGEDAVASARDISVHGCFQGTAMSHRREFEAILGAVEKQVLR
jgi:hypothetical protein